jgi:hypothetical protein
VQGLRRSYSYASPELDAWTRPVLGTGLKFFLTIAVKIWVSRRIRAIPIQQKS